MRSMNRRQTRTIRVNLPLLAVTVVLAASSAAGAHFWQQHQVRKNSGELLRLARQKRAVADELAESDAGKRQAALQEVGQTLFQYLQLRPDDAAARFELAETYDLSAATSKQRVRALELYGHAAGIAADPTPIWRRQAELHFELEQFGEADEVAMKVIGRLPNDPVALRIHARCLYRQVRQPDGPTASKVEDVLRAAAEQSPGDIDVALELAELYRDPPPRADEAFTKLNTDGASRADQVIDRAIANLDAAHEAIGLDDGPRPNGAAARDAQAITPGDVGRAYLVRSAYRRRFDLPGADEDMRKALEIAPEDVEVLLTAAEQDPIGGDVHLQTICRVAPSDPRGYLQLGWRHFARREFADAIGQWRDGLRHCGDEFIDFHLALAQGHLESGDLSAARSELDACERLAARLLLPEATRTFIDFRVALGRGACLAAEGKDREALPFVHRATLLPPKLADLDQEVAERVRAFTALGNLHLRLGQPDLAVAAFQEVTRSQAGNAAAWIQSGNALMQCGALEKALSDYELAAKLAPDSPEALAGLSQALLQEQLTLPEASRDWSRYEAVTADLRRSLDTQREQGAGEGREGEETVDPLSEGMFAADVRMALLQKDRDTALALLDGAAGVLYGGGRNRESRSAS
jgi:tetratricopeptide (TPR) repeat protein